MASTPLDELALIAAAAKEAGAIAMQFFRREPEVWWKEGDSPVSEADFAVDRFLSETLSSARPDYGWLSEETVDSPERLAARRTFVVDPIDGTRAFIGGRDTWCVSIAIVEAGRPIAGVLDCPARSEVFAASAGSGALLNGRPIRVRRPGPHLAIAGPKAMIGHLPESLGERVERQPYVPSLAYRVAMVASGAIDASFIKTASNDWDLAAADLILCEAGGRVAGPDGTLPLYAGDDTRLGPLAAGSGPLLEQMLAVIPPAAEKDGR